MTERLPWFPCYPSKLLGALAGMNPDEGYVYWVVCLRIYETGHACRDTLDALARRTGMSRRRVSEAIDLSLGAGRLVREDSGIMNPFAAGILKEANAFRESRARAGKKGADSRWGKDERNQTLRHGTANGTAIREPMANDGHLHLHLQEQEESKKERLSSLRSDWPSDYQDQFWKLYPRKTEKKAALSKLDAIKKSGKVPWVTFIAGIDRYTKHIRQARTEDRYIKQPTTWLNKGCWDDEVGQLNLADNEYLASRL